MRSVPEESIALEMEVIVGFWGVQLLAKTDRDLSSLSSVAAMGGELTWSVAGIDGWRLASLYNGSSDASRVLAAAREIDGPFMCSDVLDSDFASVLFADPKGVHGEVTLHPDLALDYAYPFDPTQNDALIPVLIEWAGQGADENEVRKAVHGKMVFAEDSFIRLAVALGALPLSEAHEYMLAPDGGSDLP
jgi:hypothetical protein